MPENILWFDLIIENKDNFETILIEAINYYEKELEQARKDLEIKGSLEKNSSSLPGIVELRFRQLQDIESILEFLNNKLKQIRSRVFRKYFEKYPRELSSREAEKYVDGEDEVVNFAILVNKISLLRNCFLAIHKALEVKVFQINNIVKLRVAGLENVNL
ncbi:MAG: hypothetical protein NZZ41_02095 [Candidatus Dojkabacteria bacterium]|nr:hypothetical protein [Candidatus Dojkabacteria bacterium]